MRLTVDDLLLRPKMRADLVLVSEVAETKALTLLDPVTGVLHELSIEGSAIVRLLNGKITLAEVYTELSEQFSFSPEAVFDFVGQLQERLLIDTPYTRERLEFEKPPTPPPPPAPLPETEKPTPQPLPEPVLSQQQRALQLTEEAIEIRPDLRFECLGSGACCSGRYHIELSASERDAIKGVNIERAFGLSLREAIASPSEDEHFLRRGELGCVFLDKDSTCKLHKRFGAEVKPRACRHFPFQPILTPAGGVIRFRPECSSQHISREEGPLIAPQRLELWRELTQEREELMELPMEVVFSQEREVDYHSYMIAETSWTQSVRLIGWRAGLELMAQSFASPKLQLEADEVALQLLSASLERDCRDLWRDTYPLQRVLPEKERRAELAAEAIALLGQEGLKDPAHFEAAARAYLLDNLAGKYPLWRAQHRCWCRAHGDGHRRSSRTHRGSRGCADGQEQP